MIDNPFEIAVESLHNLASFNLVKEKFLRKLLHQQKNKKTLLFEQTNLDFLDC